MNVLTVGWMPVHVTVVKVQLRSGNKTRSLPISEIKGLTPAVVCYHPNGKYEHQGSRVIPLSDIPEMCEPGIPRVDLREQSAGADQTWWPVTILELWRPDDYPVPYALWELEHVFCGERVTVRKTGVWIICVYQWIEVSEVWAWPTRLAHWLNM